jgi:hypothetical protein
MPAGSQRPAVLTGRQTVSSEMFCAVREISRQSPGIKLFNLGFRPWQRQLSGCYALAIPGNDD